MVARQCGCRPRQCPDRRGPGKSRLPGISPLKLRPDRPARAALPTAPPKGVAGADGVSYRPQSFVRHPPRSAGRAARDRISSHHVGRNRPRAARLRNKYYFVYNSDGCGHGPRLCRRWLGRPRDRRCPATDGSMVRSAGWTGVAGLSCACVGPPGLRAGRPGDVACMRFGGRFRHGRRPPFSDAVPDAAYPAHAPIGADPCGLPLAREAVTTPESVIPGIGDAVVRRAWRIRDRGDRFPVANARTLARTRRVERVQWAWISTRSQT